MAGVASQEGPLRREDTRLLQGRGRFVADLHPSGLLELGVLRSAHAHARLVAVDTAQAAAMEGVSCVLSGATFREKAPAVTLAPQPALAWDEVLYAGQPIAAVVARDRYVVEDALECVSVRYEPLPAVTDAEAALDEGALAVSRGRGDNVCSIDDVGYGDVEDAFARADVVVSARLGIARASGNPLEGRAILCEPQEDGSLVVTAAHQAPYLLRGGLASALGLTPQQVRVRALDVGGGFGVKNGIYPEDVLAAWCALTLQRPVRFIEDRHEHFLSTNHARQQLHVVRLAATRDGRLLGLDDTSTIDVGAYSPRVSIGMMAAQTIPGPYRLPAYRNNVRHVYTNKVPLGSYRGAGRPEGTFVMERMMDRLAQTLGIDPVLVRQRNLIGPAEMPYDTGVPLRGKEKTVVYDSGDYPRALDLVLERLDMATVRGQQECLRANGRYIGVGIALYVEDTGVGPFESASVGLHADGSLWVHCGSPAQGQGHETTFTQIAADVLSQPAQYVHFISTDTGLDETGFGTFGSRGAVQGGSAVFQAAHAFRHKLLDAAAQVMGRDAASLQLRPGCVVSADGAVRLDLQTLKSRLEENGRDDALRASVTFRPDDATYASGAHSAVVEVDARTGEAKILRYVALDDCGNVLNERLVNGQLHGGIAHGIATAFYEELRYDARGQLLTTSFMDYFVPLATDVPGLEILHLCSPSPRNPLGVKGVGEGGTMPALAVLAAAVEDALRPFGIRVDELPMTPARLSDLIAGGGHGDTDESR